MSTFAIEITSAGQVGDTVTLSDAYGQARTFEAADMAAIVARFPEMRGQVDNLSGTGATVDLAIVVTDQPRPWGGGEPMLQFPLTRPLKLGLAQPLKNPLAPTSAVTAAPDTISDLSFWHDATDSTPTEDGGALVSLTDLSGNGNILNQAGFPSARAVLQTNIFGDRNGILFASGDDYQIVDDDGIPVPSVGTYFCVFKPASVHVGGPIGRGANDNSQRGAAIRCLTNNDAVQFIIGNGSARVEAVFRDAYAGGTVLRAVARWNTTNQKFNLNGSNDALRDINPLGEGAHALGSCASTATLRIGNSNAQFLGHVAVSGLYTRYLTDEEVDQLAAYLESLYPDE